MPDVAVISLGVMSRESEARQAMQAASARMAAVITALVGQGVAERHIQTSGVSLFFDQQAQLYVASHQLTVRSDEVSTAGAILDASIEAGANASAGVQFTVSDLAATETEALDLAVANARQKAEFLAAALNVTIDGVESLIVLNGSSVHMMAAPARLKRSLVGDPTPIQSGQLTVSAEVQVKYRFH